MSFDNNRKGSVFKCKTWETQGFPGNIGLNNQNILSKTKLWRKNGLKRVNNEGDMLKTTLTTKTIISKK